MRQNLECVELFDQLLRMLRLFQILRLVIRDPRFDVSKCLGFTITSYSCMHISVKLGRALEACLLQSSLGQTDVDILGLAATIQHLNLNLPVEASILSRKDWTKF